jgi:hypothetical protein
MGIARQKSHAGCGYSPGKRGTNATLEVIYPPYNQLLTISVSDWYSGFCSLLCVMKLRYAGPRK